MLLLLDMGLDLEGMDLAHELVQPHQLALPLHMDMPLLTLHNLPYYYIQNVG